MPDALPTIVAAIWGISLWYVLLWIVLAAVVVGSLMLVRSRWASDRPLVRCVLLSLAAHAVLFGIAAMIRFVSLPPGAGKDEPVRVTIVAMAPQPSIQAPAEPAATPDPPPKEQPEVVAPELLEPAPAEPQPAPPAKPVHTPPPPAPDPEPVAEPIQEPAEMAPKASDAPAPIREPVESEAVANQVDPSPADAEAPAEQTMPPSPPAEPSPAVTPTRPAVPQSLADRVRPDRLQSVIEQGGSRETEQAVGRALEWLAHAQAADGRWDADRWQAGRDFEVLGHNREGAGAQADTGISGLAVLTFLGAGHTHLEGPYRNEVARGLVFLMRSQAADGNLSGEATRYARTYCHSMATFAVAEAYALTGDERLEPTVRRAVDYLVSCENKSHGGWRYNPGDQGDVSQLGWIIMALRSAELAGVHVPDSTWQRIEHFLGRVARGRSGGLAAYQARENWSRPMTAEAMYCRQVLGKPLAGGGQAEALSAVSGELPGDGVANYYYWYYAALALHHAQDDSSTAKWTWDRWNDRMKRELVAAQVAEGSNAGSWSPNTLWGGYGGRVYTTAMAAMCLEVYYRYGSATGERSPWIASRPRGEVK